MENNKDRRQSLLNFLSKFITSQNKKATLEEIEKNYTFHELLSLSYNIVTRF